LHVTVHPMTSSTGAAPVFSPRGAGTQAAVVTVMRIVLIVAAVVVLGGTGRVCAQSQPQGGRGVQASAASAADLHRAERMAEQARKRLEESSKRHESGWAHGGR